MTKQSKGSKPKRKRTQKIVDLDQLKSLGITSDPKKNDSIEEIDGDGLLGGKESPLSGDVCQNWPTTMGNR